MRALNELRNLKLRPNQSISSKFCVVLEKLAREANPNSSVTERSLRIRPGNAYNEIKQLAITIEQARTMYGTPRKSTPTGTEWKRRAQAYKSHRESDRFGSEPEEPHLGHEDEQKGDDILLGTVPARKTTVNVVREERTKTKRNKEKTRISDLVREARSMGMVVEKCSATSNLVGRKLTAWVSALNERVPALIDTGSMVSIVSIGLLAKAQDNGFDVDSLRVIDREALNPVFDASGSRMQFLGGVVIVVKIDGGTESEIAFYISKEKGQKILLGTNALQKLGVQIKLPIPVPVATRRTSDTGRVTIARRKYVAPLTSSLLQTRCEGEEDSVERGAWPVSDEVAAEMPRIENSDCAGTVVRERCESIIERKGKKSGQRSTEKWKERRKKRVTVGERDPKPGQRARKQKKDVRISYNKYSNQIPKDT
ncbi:hypothetical protein OSTOST_24780, partial [Ostertagia ostertagi]